MREVIAIIRREKARKTKESCGAAGLSLTSCNVVGRGKERGLRYHSRPGKGGGAGAGIAYLPKVMLTLVVRDEDVDGVVKLIMEQNRTGSVGDGKVFVCPMEEAVRIRTGERGAEALT